jgi:hypothetical protein
MPPTPRSPGARNQGAKKKPNVRLPSSSSSGGTSNRLLLLVAGAVGIVVVVAGLGFALLGGGGGASSDAPRLLQAAGCTLQVVKAAEPRDHSVPTAEGTSKQWNTSPPTSGPHFQVPAIWGAYSEPLLPAQVVHNLEHGGIFVEYGKDVPQATIDQLKGFYNTHQNGTLLAPLPSLGSKIALGVWTTSSASSQDSGTGRLAKCSTFDEKAYAAYFDAYQFHGPERFPASGLLPGT